MSLSVSRRARLAGGSVAAVVVLAVVLVIVLNAGGGSGVRLSAPSYIPDPVPTAKTLSEHDVPDRCGVGTATLHRYVPDADRTDPTSIARTRCQWHSYTRHEAPCPGPCPDGVERFRELNVDFTVWDPKASDGAPLSHALAIMNPADPKLVAAGSPERPVGGIGDEALYHYAAGESSGVDPYNGGALLRFRTGATAVRVSYGGSDTPSRTSTQPRQVAEKEAKAVVFAIAAEIARALHAPAKPALAAPAPSPAPVHRLARPCDLVSDDLVDRLAKGAVRRFPEHMSADTDTYGEAVDACEWSAPERDLRVTVWSESEWRPGIAAAQATRLYLEQHAAARYAAATFHAGRGLGDQAYAAYYGGGKEPDDGGGEVAFRYRNVVVLVRYTGGEHSAPDGGTAVNGAYTVAADVRGALR